MTEARFSLKQACLRI